jgi:hypothetical protein
MTIIRKIQLDSQKLKEKLNLKDGLDGKSGSDGKDYILTAKDKTEIAGKIKVPIVEKETIVKEQPIITQEIKEVAKYEEPDIIVEKINTLENVLDYKVLKNIPELEVKPNGGGWRNLWQMHDVSVPTPTNGQSLIYNATNKLWEAGTIITTDEKVKYDAGDPTAGYLGAKIVAGTGITLSEGTGADENKLKITNSLDLSGYVPYTGATTDVDLNAKVLKNFFISKTADVTAKFAFDVGALSTSTIRTLGVPDRSFTLDNITTSTTSNGTGFVKANGSVISFDNSTYLTSVTAHNLLSTTHGDTLADSVASGDLMYGNSTPKWSRLAKGADGKFLKLVAGLPSWETVTSVSFGTTTQIPYMNAGGTDFIYSANLTFNGSLLAVTGNVSVTDEAYGAGWDGSTNVPTKNAVYDKIQTLSGGTPGGSSGDIQYNNAGAFGGFGDWNGSVFAVGGNVSVTDDAYAAGWNGSTNVPTKNAIYDKIEALSLASGLSSGVSGAIQFSNGSGGFLSDETVLFWDNTNNRLGLGTATPSSKLHVITNSEAPAITVDRTDSGGNLQEWKAFGTTVQGITGTGAFTNSIPTATFITASTTPAITVNRTDSGGNLQEWKTYGTTVQAMTQAGAFTNAFPNLSVYTAGATAALIVNRSDSGGILQEWKTYGTTVQTMTQSGSFGYSLANIVAYTASSSPAISAARTDSAGNIQEWKYFTTVRSAIDGAGNFTIVDDSNIYLGTGNDASLYYNGTNLIINPKVVGTGYLSILGDTRVLSDTYGFYTGAGSDMKIIYDGTQGIIDTSLVAPSDLRINTGASKTIILGNVARLSMRPTLIANKIVKVGPDYYIKPTQVDYGASSGYSMPIYASDDEEIYFNELIAGRWDEASDIIVSVVGYLSAGEDVGDDFALQLSWANKSTSSGVFPSTTTDVEVRTNIDTSRNAQYSIYKVDFTIDWDNGTPDILSSDIFCGRLRRIAVGGGYTEMSGEFVVQSIVVTYNVNKVFKRA